MSDTLKRIKQYLDYKGINIRSFEISVGFSNGAFASQLKNGKTIGVDKLENILKTYSEIDANWLLTGRGKMLLESELHFLTEPSQEYKTPENELIDLLKDQLQDLKKDKERLHSLLETKMGNQKGE